MRKKSELNCPNCGAPITGEYCPYCGSVFYDWAALDVDEPKRIKLELEKKLLEAKIESLNAQQNIAEMFNGAIAAMKRYKGGRYV